MGRVKKMVNANYLSGTSAQNAKANEQNRKYIDRFVAEEYSKLSGKFGKIGSNINSSCYGSMDKLNETILSLYIDTELCFTNWQEAKQYLQNKFTEKDIRIPTKKPTTRE